MTTGSNATIQFLSFKVNESHLLINDVGHYKMQVALYELSFCYLCIKELIRALKCTIRGLFRA